MIVLWILLAILLLLALLLSCPVWLILSYDGVFQVRLRLFFFFRWQLFPRTQKPPEELTQRQRERLARKEARKAERAARKKAREAAKKEKKAGKKPKQSAELEKKGKRSAKEWFHLILELATGARGGVRMIFRAFRIAGLTLYGVITGADAADTALKFGRVHRYLYTAMAVLEQVMTFEGVNICLTPDFLGEKDRWEGELLLRICPICLLIGAVRTVFGVLFRWIRREGGQTSRGTAPAGRAVS